MKYVLDSSVALCWVIPRPLTPRATLLRDEYRRKVHELLSPTIFIDEVASALTKSERQKDIAVGQAAEVLRVPVFANGMGRGTLPPEHPLAFAKARRVALSGADLVVVVGTPLDFRLGFGDFGAAQVVHIVDAQAQRASQRNSQIIAHQRRCLLLRSVPPKMENPKLGPKIVEELLSARE